MDIRINRAVARILAKQPTTKLYIGTKALRVVANNSKFPKLQDCTAARVMLADQFKKVPVKGQIQFGEEV